jgi:hypothetical protein
VIRCPDEATVDEALDRTLDAASDADLRAHVAGCDECLGRFGARFELELWMEEATPAAPIAERTAAPSARRVRRLRPLLAAAAALLLVVYGALRLGRGGPPRPAPASAVEPFHVAEFTTSVGTSGPRGARSITSSRRAEAPFVIEIEERRVDRAGLVEVHQRTVPTSSAR